MTKHYAEDIFIPASSQEIFEFVDDPMRLSSHMGESAWMMGGGHMEAQVDEGRGQRIGSHIKLSGKAFGISVYLDEVITLYEPPRRKAWETVGEPKLIVIGHYRLGFEIKPEEDGSRLKVFIDYELPQSPSTRWLGRLMSGPYAKWCVRQMLDDTKRHFDKKMTARSF